MKHKRFDAKQAFKQRDGMTALHMAAKGGLSVNHGVHDSVNRNWKLATTTKKTVPAMIIHYLNVSLNFVVFFDVLIGKMMNRIMMMKKMRIRSSVNFNYICVDVDDLDLDDEDEEDFLKTGHGVFSQWKSLHIEIATLRET